MTTNREALDRAIVEDGWDDEGSVGTDPEARARAERLATTLDARGIADAFVAPSPDGGLCFYWHANEFGAGVCASMEIDRDENGRWEYGAFVRRTRQTHLNDDYATEELALEAMLGTVAKLTAQETC